MAWFCSFTKPSEEKNARIFWQTIYSSANLVFFCQSTRCLGNWTCEDCEDHTPSKLVPQNLPPGLLSNVSSRCWELPIPPNLPQMVTGNAKISPISITISTNTFISVNVPCPACRGRATKARDRQPRGVVSFLTGGSLPVAFQGFLKILNLFCIGCLWIVVFCILEWICFFSKDIGLRGTPFLDNRALKLALMW